jgi:hypothetical protein
MADETVGQKMSAYTALAAGEKTYFMGDGNGSVVAVGKVASGGNDVNRLVKLSDLQVQADWQEGDPSKPSYIKHRLQAQGGSITDPVVVLKGFKAGEGITFENNGGVITIKASTN